MMALVPREFHRFKAAGKSFLYLVPSAAIFALDEATAAVLRVVSESTAAAKTKSSRRCPDRFDPRVVRAAVSELTEVRAIGYEHQPDAAVPRMLPMMPFPLNTMVLNVTNQCNLACTYCYEYGEDKIVDTANGRQPKFMTEETARESVEFLLRESGRIAHMTFFGGETLLNFPVLQSTIAYARRRAADEGKEIDFSLTTNATLLRPDIIEFLAENHVGVTISIDGPREMQDKFRVFHNGAGSYDVVAPKIKELLRRHRSRPIGARVTLTSDTLDITRIYRHLTEEIGFWEVGFAPVTTSPQQQYAIGEHGFDRDARSVPRRSRANSPSTSVDNRHHGFSNVKDTLEEIHKGVSKAYPCGAGLGLLGVSTDGDVALCHRFAGSDAHKFGTVRDGIDREAQTAFLERASHRRQDRLQHVLGAAALLGRLLPRSARPLRATRRIRTCTTATGFAAGPTRACEIYGELSERNPEFLAQFDREEAKAEAAI